MTVIVFKHFYNYWFYRCWWCFWWW